MRGVILFSLMVAIGWAVADDAKPKGKPVRVIAAWERLPGSGEFQPSLVRGSDDLWHVRGEKAPFTGKVVHEFLGRPAYETTYAKGLRHGEHTTWHRNGVISSLSIYKRGVRERHREWDVEGGQVERAQWNFDGTPKKKSKGK